MAPSVAGACCGRPLAAMAYLTAALWGSRGGLEGAGEWMRTGVALQVRIRQVASPRPGARTGELPPSDCGVFDQGGTPNQSRLPAAGLSR